MYLFAFNRGYDAFLPPFHFILGAELLHSFLSVNQREEMSDFKNEEPLHFGTIDYVCSSHLVVRWKRRV